MTNTNVNNKISAGWNKTRNTRYLASFILIISLALATGIVLPSSYSSSSSSSLSSSPFPYMPGLGPMNNNNTAAIMGQINNVTNLRTYGNTAFGVSIQYPAVWGAVELKSSPFDNKFPGSSIALFTAPLENATDTFREKALLSIQDFSSAGNVSGENMTLAKYTNGSLSSYRNISSIAILESNATTFAGQPAHRVVYTEDMQNQQFKKTQVWTVKDNKAYVITFSAQEPRYNDYLPSIESMINSFKINATQASDTTMTSATTGLANLSPSNTGQRPRNLTFSGDSAGIQMQYPSNWTKVQPGAPLDNRKFAILVSFISPLTYDNGTSPTGNASAPFSSVNIGMHDLRPSGASRPSNVTLEEYNAFQSDSISRQGANILESDDMTLGGLLGHRISYTHGNNNDKEEKQTLQMWALKGDKVYHFIFTAHSDIFGQHLSTAQNMAKSLQLK